MLCFTLISAKVIQILFRCISQTEYITNIPNSRPGNMFNVTNPLVREIDKEITNTYVWLFNSPNTPHYTCMNGATHT